MLEEQTKSSRIKDLPEFRFHATMCEVAHTSPENWEGIGGASPELRLGNVRAMGGIMPRTNLWDRSVPRVELDRRSREARLRFEQTDRLFVLSATVKPSRLRRLLYFRSRSADTADCRKQLS